MRKRLTYANVMTTIGVFLLLAGGTAIAAGQLAKNSVGPKQLKKNAVTTAKIKKAAVTKAKLGKNAVTSTAIADGAVTGADIAPGSTPYSQRVARMTTSLTAPFKAAGPYPIGTYTQNAGEDNQILGGIDIRFSAACTPPRAATAYLLVDAANPATPQVSEIAGYAIALDENAGELTRRFDFGSFIGGYGSLNLDGPPAAVAHRLDAYLLEETCTAGEGIDAVGAIVDVIGSK